MSEKAHWNDRYADGSLPWDTGRVDAHVAAADLPATGRVLEVGCGTGTNAVWLAQRGLTVTALDLSPLAVSRARARAEAAGVPLTVLELDFLSDTVPGAPFDLVFDRGVFHVFDAPEARDAFAARVAALLAEGGRWLSIIGSTEGPPRDGGPPRRSARDVLTALEPHLELVSLQSTRFSTTEDGGNPPAAWRCESRRRTVPAQPGTRRQAARAG